MKNVREDQEIKKRQEYTRSMHRWKRVASAAALAALTALPVSTTLCALHCAPAAGSTTTVTGSSAAHHGSRMATREASDHPRRPVGVPSGNDCGDIHETVREAPATRTSSGVVLSFELTAFLRLDATFRDEVSRHSRSDPSLPPETSRTLAPLVLRI